VPRAAPPEASAGEAVCLVCSKSKEVDEEMPIYDSRCLECGKISEVFVRSSEQSSRCQDCGSTNVERLISSSYMVTTTNRAPGATYSAKAGLSKWPTLSTLHCWASYL
jgi:putative FmdB family regulatory protein